MTDHRQWHQKLRWWVLIAFVAVLALDLATNGAFLRFADSLTSDCADYNYRTGGCW